MAERAERSGIRKTIDKVGYLAAFVTLPLGVYTAGTSLLVGEIFRSTIFGTLAFLDFTQIREHGKEKQSWYNPERIMDRIWRGSNRLRQTPSSRMVYAAA